MYIHKMGNIFCKCLNCMKKENNEVHATLTPYSHTSKLKNDEQIINEDIQVLDLGQPSNSETRSNNTPSFVCEICVELKPLHDSFNMIGCTHFYCTQCIVKYIVSKLEDSVSRIPCPEPNCSEGILEPEYCRLILPNQVFVKWGNALCESAIISSMKFYCPYKDCPGMLISELGREEDVKQLRCPFSKRLLCLQRKVPWHTEFLCAEFQKLQKLGPDAMARSLAQKRSWRMCSGCKNFVEKSCGCSYIKCRCGHTFCYECGADLSKQDSHTCPSVRLCKS